LDFINGFVLISLFLSIFLGGLSADFAGVPVCISSTNIMLVQPLKDFSLTSILFMILHAILSLILLIHTKFLLFGEEFFRVSDLSG